jgi:hypothetical protein
MKVQSPKVERRAPKRLTLPISESVAEAPPDSDAAQLAVVDAEARSADHEVRVALAAYFIAEKRGFGPGHELADWLAAEAELAKVAQPLPAGSAVSIERRAS